MIGAGSTGRVMAAEFWAFEATPQTLWHMVALRDDDGHEGWGEATLTGHAPQIEAQAARLLGWLIGRPGRPSSDPGASGLPFDTLPEAAVSSAIEQALWDLSARRAGTGLAVALGGGGRDRVALYANFNRRTQDRSPDGMARSARAAQAAGHVAFKIAPFDEVRPDLSREAMRAAMQPGLDRLAAIADALGPGVRLMADCHWRFDPAGAQDLIDACAGTGLYWIECPIAETPATIDDVVALRRRANARGIRLAGLETAILRAAFRPWLRAGAYDVAMPDVKYAGGPAEMRALAQDFACHGTEFSPHNPSGPICHAQSLHICAALERHDLLEVQFDETPAFDALAGQPMGGVVAGQAALPDGCGGIGLRPDLMTAPGARRVFRQQAGGAR